MKRLLIIITTLAMIIGLCSCDSALNNNNGSDETEQSYMTTHCSKENVENFCEIVGKLQGDGLLSGFVLDKDTTSSLCFLRSVSRFCANGNVSITSYSKVIPSLSPTV